MTPQEKRQELAQGLHQVRGESGLRLQTELSTHGDVEVVVVRLEDREAFPIYITVDESQILCLSPLWTEAEVLPETRGDLLDILLTMNIPMPLSAFSKVGHQYIIFNALSLQATLNQVIEEIEVLSDNALMAIDELNQFLTSRG